MLAILVIIPFAAALLSFLPAGRIFRVRLFTAIAVGHALMVASFWRQMPQPEFGGYLVLDALGLLLLSVISFIFVAVSVYMLGYYEHEQRSTKTLVACLLFLLSMMTLVGVSYHMGLLWVAIETTTLFSAPLISYHRTRESLEATWKYLLVCSLGIALALMGTFFLAIAAHQAHTLFLPGLLASGAGLSVEWLKIAVIFLLVGYGCKLGLAPMHSWKPEAYGHATGMVAVLMAGGLTQCAFLALVRVSQICARNGLTEFYGSILIVTGLLSLLVAAVFILGENRLKRSFAYSSIEHMGILVLGLGIGGAGVYGAIFHMVNNALAKVVMFLTAGSIAQKYGSTRTGDVRGVIHTYPVTGIFLLVALLGGVGMFPFATFHSELLIFGAAVAGGHYILVGGFLVCLAVMFIGMARIVLDCVYGEPTAPVLARRENFWMNVPIAYAAAALLALGLWQPAGLDRMIRCAAALVK